MLNIIIVEDEVFVRKSLRNAIESSCSNFRVVAEAGDGEQALKFMEKSDVDLIITDIVMPTMDGLEFIRKARASYEDIEIIVLSCFDKFDYAKEAMKYGVQHYFFKAETEPEEIIDAIKEIDGALVEKRAARHAYAQASENIYSNQLELQSKFFKELLWGPTMTESQIVDKFSALHMSLLFGSLFLVYLELDEYDELLESTSNQDVNLIDFAITNVLTELLETNGIGVLSIKGIGQYFVIGNMKEGGTELDLENSINPVFIHLSELIRDMFGLTLTAGVSSIHSEFTNIRLAYKQAEKAFRHRFFLEKGILIFFNSIPNSQPCQEKLKIRSEFFLTALNNRNIHQLKNEIDKGLDDALSMGCTEKDIRRTASEILLLISYKSIEKAAGAIDTINTPFHIMEEIKRIDTFSELKHYLNGQAEAFFYYYWDSSNDMDSSSIADKIKMYVENNYMENINLNVISQSLGINPCYASIVFKDKTGINFIDFFINYRITKAKEFMESLNISIQKVGSLVGYQNPQYFCKVFKRRVGMSASEYRRIIVSHTSKHNFQNLNIPNISV